MSELQRGVVKWFNDAKGFGFIEHTSGKDVFVHYSVIQTDGFKTLKDGEEVNYELSEGDKGLHAAKVVRVQAPASAAAPAESASMVAPNLEGGLVNTMQKTNADMIEIERSGSSASRDSHFNEDSNEDEIRSLKQ